MCGQEVVLRKRRKWRDPDGNDEERSATAKADASPAAEQAASPRRASPDPARDHDQNDDTQEQRIEVQRRMPAGVPSPHQRYRTSRVAVATRYKWETPMRASLTRLRTRAYQFSLRTGKPPDDVLGEFAARRMPGIAVAERGPNYLVLRPQQRRQVRRRRRSPPRPGDRARGPHPDRRHAGARHPPAAGAAAGRAACCSTTVPISRSRRRRRLGGTRVTVHGQASSELAAALDAYLGSLPRLTLENIGSGPPG